MGVFNIIAYGLFFPSIGVVYMLINIDELLAGEERELEFKENIEIPKVYSKFTSVPVVVKGKISKVGDDFRFEGNVSADLHLVCDSCLTEFSKTIDFPVFGIFKRETDDEEDYIISDNVIDLSSMVLTELLLNFPMRNICREDCKGLCIKCGHNLNISDCGCDRTVRNPEFEKLRSLFDQEV